MLPPQPWPMEVIVGLTLVFSFAAVIWVAIGVGALVKEVRRRRARKHWEDVVVRFEINAGPFLHAMAQAHEALGVTMRQMGDAMQPLLEQFWDLEQDIRLMHIWEDDGGRPWEDHEF